MVAAVVVILSTVEEAAVVVTGVDEETGAVVDEVVGAAVSETRTPTTLLSLAQSSNDLPLLQHTVLFVVVAAQKNPASQELPVLSGQQVSPAVGSKQ